MSWVAVGTAVVGTAVNAIGQKKAAAAQQKGYNAATAEQARQFDIAREDQMPWMQAGHRALGQMEQLNAGNFSSFKESPDYQFALTQGLQGLDRSAAARGALWSGGADADRMAYASGLASQNYGNYYNRLAGLAGIGQSTATNLGNVGMTYAANVGNLAVGAGNARASGYQQRYGGYANALTGIGGAINNWYSQRSVGA